jgi:hypothetical protein
VNPRSMRIAAYRSDPRVTALAAQRDAVVSHTTVLASRELLTY